MTAAATDDVIDRWTAAERAGDHVTLQELIAEDFLFVGPLGFVLDKEQWVERHRADQLHHTRFAIEDTRTRTYGDVTVLVGVQDQQGDYRGRPIDGRFRLTLILAGGDGDPRIAGGHLSPIAPPPAASQ